jgi:hypothetical protein
MFSLLANNYSSQYLNLKFPMGKSVNSTYTFDIFAYVNRNIAQETPTGGDIWSLAMNIEFVKED